MKGCVHSCLGESAVGGTAVGGTEHLFPVKDGFTILERRELDLEFQLHELISDALASLPTLRYITFTVDISSSPRRTEISLTLTVRRTIVLTATELQRSSS